MQFVTQIAAVAIIVFARFITAVRGVWQGSEPEAHQRIYFANHASHGDFILVWTVLPPWLRRKTRPVAGADYWLKTPLRRFVGCEVFDAVLIDRNHASRTRDPIEAMVEALDGGASLLIFPEGTRNESDAPLLPFKSGIYHLAKARPEIELLPVWIDNLNRVMPKGEFVPVPLICTVTFGSAVRIGHGESKEDFLTRAREALLALSPKPTDLRP